MKLSRFCKLISLNGKFKAIINCLNRAIVELSPDKASVLEKMYDNVSSLALLDDESLNLLKTTGLVLEDSVDEIDLFRRWFENIKLDTSIIKAVVLLTSRCNLGCTYCFEDGYIKNRQLDMDRETASRIINWLHKFAKKHKSKEMKVYFYGGEPTLNPEMLEFFPEELICATSREGITPEFYMYTNGTILNDHLIKVLENYKFKYLQITLDGPPEIHNKRRPFKTGKRSYKVIHKNINRILRDTNSKVLLLINFDLQNYQALPSFLDEISEFKDQNFAIAFSPVFETKCNLEHCNNYRLPSKQYYHIWADLLKIAARKGFSCNPIRIFDKGPCTFWRLSHLVFDPLGNIYKCIGMPGMEEYKIGNVSQGFSPDLIERIYKYIEMTPWDNDECRKCAYLPLCLGGCRLHCVMENGNITDTFCHKELIENCEIEMIRDLISRKMTIEGSIE